MESGSGTQTVAGDADSTDNKTGFARVGDKAEPLHEQVHTVLVNENKDAVGKFANGSSDVKDVSALPQQGGRTCLHLISRQVS